MDKLKVKSKKEKVCILLTQMFLLPFCCYYVIYVYFVLFFLYL